MSNHFPGLSESGSGITGNLHNNPHTIKGIKTTVVADSHTFRPRVFFYHHIHHLMLERFNSQGPDKLRILVCEINPTIMGEE